MKNDEERIGFVIRFAEMDFAHLRAGDLLNLQEELLAFLDWPPDRRKELNLEALTSIQKKTKEEVENIAAAVRRGEEAAANHPTLKEIIKEHQQLAKEGRGRGRAAIMPPNWALPLPGTPTAGLWHRGGFSLKTVMFHPQTPQIGYAFPLSLIQGDVVFEPKEGKMQLRAESGTLSDSFFLAFAVALNNIDLRRVRQCPAVLSRHGRICARIFFAEHGNQEFCSSQCASRERTRRLRAAAKSINEWKEQEASISQRSKSPKRKGGK